ncbi:hypothetical protein ACET3Z_014729 [Daucus carota]
METIDVILQHSGEWDDNRNYINFEVCGLLIPNDCDYNNLVVMIYNELKLEPSLVGIRIEYQARDGYPPFKIADDGHLMFYIELKKKEFHFTKFPLCLTNERKSIQPFSTTSDQLYSEATQSEGVASNIIHEQSVGTVSDVVEDYVEFAEVVAGQIVAVDEVANNCIEQNQLNKEVVISNKNHVANSIANSELLI